MIHLYSKKIETWSFRWLMSTHVTVLGTFSGKPINFRPEASPIIGAEQFMCSLMHATNVRTM